MEEQQAKEVVKPAKESLYIYGTHPVMEAIKSNTELESIYILQGTRGELEVTLRQWCKVKQVPFKVVPKERLNKLVNGNHQGVIAQKAVLTYENFDEFLPELLERKPEPLLLVLDGVTDVGNVGAIARSAVCMGVDAIIIPTQGAAQLGAKAVKASAGALEKIPICRQKSFANTIAELQMNDFTVIATDLQAEKSIHELELEGPIALIMGSEDKGVAKYLLKAADERFKLPQVSDFDSLNVSVATGVVLYELLRRKL